jgi:hypothetical protein
MPDGADLKVSEPHLRGTALRNIASSFGIPFDIALTVAINSGSRTRSNCVIAFQFLWELGARLSTSHFAIQ